MRHLGFVSSNQLAAIGPPSATTSTGVRVMLDMQEEEDAIRQGLQEKVKKQVTQEETAGVMIRHALIAAIGTGIGIAIGGMIVSKIVGGKRGTL